MLLGGIYYKHPSTLSSLHAYRFELWKYLNDQAFLELPEYLLRFPANELQMNVLRYVELILFQSLHPLQVF